MKRILETTEKNIKRNKILSISTIFVIGIVFTLCSFFISLSIIAKKAVTYYEQKAQVIVFFKKDAPEEKIFDFRDAVYDENLVESIEYISQEDALEIYREDFADNPDLIATVTADALPPSLEIRATSIDNLLTVIENINTLRETNAYVDDVMYFKDVVENIKTLSRIINIGSIALISSLGLISFFLIRLTIGLNIKNHGDEIEIMNLVGSTDNFIRYPYILEGGFYGLIGGFVSASLIIIPWYIFIHYLSTTDGYFWISQMIRDFGLDFLLKPTFLFLIIYYFAHILIGILFGALSSFSAVHKYLEEDEKKK
jgi:cell division transport system permease protein